MAKASVECGFRSVLVSGINDFSSSLEEVEADFNTYNQYDELIRYCLGFHAEYTCSEELFKKDCRAVTALQGSCIAHMSETERKWQSVYSAMELHLKLIWIPWLI